MGWRRGRGDAERRLDSAETVGERAPGETEEAQSSQGESHSPRSMPPCHSCNTTTLAVFTLSSGMVPV